MIRKNRFSVFLLFAAVILISIFSCDPGNKYEEEEAALIQDYISAHPDLNFELKPSGLYYMDVEAGTGRQAVTHDTAYVRYDLALVDGSFGSSNYEDTIAYIFPVDEGWNIDGFDEGITYMKEGGKSVLLIPSALGYGRNGYYPYIDGYAPLLYEIELVLVKPGPEK